MLASRIPYPWSTYVYRSIDNRLCGHNHAHRIMSAVVNLISHANIIWESTINGRCGHYHSARVMIAPVNLMSHANMIWESVDILALETITPACHPVVCRDKRIPAANSYETTWLNTPTTPSVVFRLDAHPHIEIPARFCTLLLSTQAAQPPCLRLWIYRHLILGNTIVIQFPG